MASPVDMLPAIMPSRWCRCISTTSGHTLSADNLANAVTGGVTFGEFDAFVGVSLDDGTIRQDHQLSRSADLRSLTCGMATVYPGHVHNVVHQVFNG